MNFKIRLHSDAVKFLIDLNPEMKERLKSGIKSLETDPFKADLMLNKKVERNEKKRKILLVTSR